MLWIIIVIVGILRIHKVGAPCFIYPCYHTFVQVVNKKTEQKPDDPDRILMALRGVSRVCFTAAKLLLPLFFFLLFTYHLLFLGRIYPGVKIAGVDVGGKTKEHVQGQLQSIQPTTLTIINDGKEFVLSLSVFEISYDWQKSAQGGYLVGRQGNILTTTKQKLDAFSKNINLPLSFNISEESLDGAIASVSAQISQEPVEPSVSIQNRKAVVNPGKAGIVVKIDDLKREILESIAFAKNTPIPVPLERVSSQLTGEDVEKLAGRAQSLVGKKIQIKFEYDIFSYPDNELVSLLTPDGFDREKIASLAASIAKGVERPPQNARFLFEEGRVKEFVPAKVGVTVKQAETEDQIENKLERLSNTEEKTAGINLPVATALPALLTQDVNLLGIKELIGRGTSLFRGSIPGRVHNIALAASKINGLLIKPGEVFSFNEALGDVSVFTGYQQAYVIKEGRTVLGDGGGVCQVSTTFFRAALNSGLPIVERHPHSYRVGYYEQDSKPGIDATIYSPSVDLKVKNDTAVHILIQAKADTKNKSLVIEFYGSPDGRVAQISTPSVSDIKLAPPPLYQEDPTLPAGTVKQIDFSADGARTVFAYKVIRGSAVLQDRVFTSNYRPWQAVYLRGTAAQ